VQETIEKAKVKKVDKLVLKNMTLKRVPPSICELINLRSLILKRNELTELPIELENLVNLELLSLTNNNFDYIPPVVFKLKNLRTLAIGGNHIKILPPEIGQLKKLRTISLTKNHIEVIPKEITKLLQLETLHLRSNEIKELPLELCLLYNLKIVSLGDNPIVFPPEEIVKQGIYRVMTYLLGQSFGKDEAFEEYTLPLPNKIRIAVKQYLVYFTEFVQVAKGKNIHFEVKNAKNGLEISISKKENFDNFVEYLDEYIGFIKTNIDRIEPKVESNINNTQKDLLIIDLRNQIRFLYSSIEIKAIENRMLNDTIEKFYNLLSFEKRHPQPILIETKSSSLSNSSTVIGIHFNIEKNLGSLRNNIEQFREIIKNGNKDLHDELEEVDKGLCAIEESDAEVPGEVDNAPFKKLKRILEEINNPDSFLRKTIENTQKGIQSAKKLASTYNKFAQWLGMPQVPDVFLK